MKNLKNVEEWRSVGIVGDRILKEKRFLRIWVLKEWMKWTKQNKKEDEWDMYIRAQEEEKKSKQKENWGLLTTAKSSGCKTKRTDFRQHRIGVVFEVNSNDRNIKLVHHPDAYIHTLPQHADINLPAEDQTKNLRKKHTKEMQHKPALS